MTVVAEAYRKHLSENVKHHHCSWGTRFSSDGTEELKIRSRRRFASVEAFLLFLPWSPSSLNSNLLVQSGLNKWCR